MRTAITILMLAGLAMSAGPETKLVRNRRAVAAKQVYERAASAAQVAYHKAMKAASDRYAGELDAAMAEATRAGDLEEALAIRAEKETIGRDDSADGLWKVSYSTGATRLLYVRGSKCWRMILSEDGTVERNSGGRSVLRHGEEVDVAAFTGDAVRILHFHPAASYAPKGKPKATAAGVRVGP